MTKSRLIVLACFCAAFLAGGAVGMALKPRAARGSLLERELSLTGEQREKLRVIWSETTDNLRRQQREHSEALHKERDAAIASLFTPEQKAQYDEVMQEYARKSAVLAEERRKAFEDAVERTKVILTEPQRSKYEDMLKQRAGWHRRRGGQGLGAEDKEGPAPPRGGE